VTEGDHDHTEVDWSPRGDLLAFVSARHDNRETTCARTCDLCPDGSGLRAVTHGGLGVDRLRFTPDGATLCFTGPEPTGRRCAVCRNESLWTVPVDSPAEPRRITDQSGTTSRRRAAPRAHR
jgi:dipeptidyl aminopeptidase/acylaminoacyl peptidase